MEEKVKEISQERGRKVYEYAKKHATVEKPYSTRWHINFKYDRMGSIDVWRKEILLFYS